MGVRPSYVDAARALGDIVAGLVYGERAWTSWAPWPTPRWRRDPMALLGVLAAYEPAAQERWIDRGQTWPLGVLRPA